MPYFSGPNGIREVADPGERVMQSFQDSRRKRLLSDYFANGQTDLGQLAKYDPEAAQQIQAQQKEREFGSALSKLLLAPEEQRPQGLAALVGMNPREALPYVKAFDPRLAGAGDGVPSELQVFQSMTKGMGEDDVMKARRVALGLDPRQSSAAISYQKVVGADGRERIVGFDPRQIGAVDMSSGQAFGSGVGQPSIAPPPSLSSGDMFAGLGNIPGVQVTSGLRTPERNAKVGGVANSYHLTDQARDILPPKTPEQAQQVRQFAAQNGLEIIDEGDHWHMEPRGKSNPAGGPQFASQTPQEKAYATESGQQRAQLDALPERGGLEAQIAAMKASMEAQAKASAERESIAATKAIDSQRTLGLLDEAERLLPLSTGSAAGNVMDSVAGAFGKSTPGAQAIAGLQTIAGQLTSSMPRMQGPQSDKDVQLYKQMAGDLANPNLPTQTRLAALKQIRRLNQKYAGQQDRSASPSLPVSGSAPNRIRIKL